MEFPRRLSRYELLEEIGRGNMGVVYKARDPVIDRTVAIKVVRLGFSLGDEKRREFLDRFEREARIAGKLSHTNIIAVHDVGLEDEPYLVMEHFPGVDLGRLLSRGPLPEDDARRIIFGLADALDYAHGQGVVHRDIKPANVLYRDDGNLKLVDFGIARLESSELTATGEFMGTPSYMAPETFSGDRVDGRADLFSLGVLLYQMLTGKRPFEASNVSRTIYRVMHDEPEPPTRLRAGLTPGWDIVCARLLAKAPADRYASAESLKADLEALERGTLAPPPADEPTVRIGWAQRWLSQGRIFVPVAAVVGAGLYFASQPTVSPSAPVLSSGEGAGPSPPSSSASSSASASDTSLDTPPANIAPAPPPFEPMRFVARHEHRVGHCTGDLVLDTSRVRFSSSRHEWSWPYRRVRSFERLNESELRLVVEDPGDGEERLDFTFLRPRVSPSGWSRFERHRTETGTR